MYQKYIQLFLRLAVASAFLSAVADRIGIWGAPGSPNVLWGSWENFVLYSNSLNYFFSPAVGRFLAILATGFEVVFAFLLLAGFKTRIISFASGILLTLFALSMTMALGIKSTFDYSVWIGVGACFLLGTVNEYYFSLDSYLKNKNLGKKFQRPQFNKPTKIEQS